MLMTHKSTGSLQMDATNGIAHRETRAGIRRAIKRLECERYSSSSSEKKSRRPSERPFLPSRAMITMRVTASEIS